MTMDLSRRRLLATCAASLACTPSLVRAQTAKPPQTGTHLPPASSSATTAVNDIEQHLLIDVMINDAGPFRFVVDTGADRTVLATDVAESLGIATERQIMVEGIVRTISAPTVPIRRFTFGPITRENLVLPLLPRDLLEVDGYLGLDVIDGYRVTFDFARHELVVDHSHPRATDMAPSRPNEIVIPVFGDAGRLRATSCWIDGIHTTTLIDSGAEVTVGNSTLLSALVAQDASYLTPGTVEISGVTGGSIEGKVTIVKRIKLDNLNFANGAAAIADLQIFDLWKLNDVPALLIGMNWLRQFSRVSIDYERKELEFDLASNVRVAGLAALPS